MNRSLLNQESGGWSSPAKRRRRELPSYGVAVLSDASRLLRGQIRRGVNCIAGLNLISQSPGGLDKAKVWKLFLDVEREPLLATSRPIERLRARILKAESIADAGLDADVVAATAEGMRC